MKDKLISAKNYVADHKTVILGSAVAVLTTAVVAQQIGIRGLNKFLDEKGLSEEYYAEED